MTGSSSTIPLKPKNVDYSTTDSSRSTTPTSNKFSTKVEKSRTSMNGKSKHKKFQISKHNKNFDRSISKSTKSATVSLSPRKKKKKDRSSSSSSTESIVGQEVVRSEQGASDQSSVCSNRSATNQQENQFTTEESNVTNSKSNTLAASDSSTHSNSSVSISTSTSSRTSDNDSGSSTNNRSSPQKHVAKRNKIRNKKSTRISNESHSSSTSSSTMELSSTPKSSSDHGNKLHESKSTSSGSSGGSSSNHKQPSKQTRKRNDLKFSKVQKGSQHANNHKQGYKGQSKKAYSALYNKSNKQRTNAVVVQERDVHDDTCHVDNNNDTRTAVSPVNMVDSVTNVETGMTALDLDEGLAGMEGTEETTLLSQNGIVSTTRSSITVKVASEKTTNNATTSATADSSRGGKHFNRKKDGKYQQKSGKGSLRQYHKHMKKHRSLCGNDAPKDEEHDLPVKSHNDDMATFDGNGSRPASPSSVSNVVTTNAAGQALLNRLGSSVTSVQGDVEVDIDASTAFSGDVSGISMDPTSSQNHDQCMMYPNPIVFPPIPPSAQQQRMVHDSMIATTTPISSRAYAQQPQWIIPPQSDLSHQEYNDMMAYYSQQQQYPAMYSTVVPSPLYGTMGSSSTTTAVQAMAVHPSNFYGQTNVQVQTPLPPQMYHQPHVMYSVPKPTTYEQVTIGGCVYFNPVYDVPAIGDDKQEVQQLDDLSGNLVEISINENKVNHGEQSDAKQTLVEPSRKTQQEQQKRKNKFSKRSKNKRKQYKKKSNKEEKSNKE